jgi:hypothetical protein
VSPIESPLVQSWRELENASSNGRLHSRTASRPCSSAPGSVPFAILGLHGQEALVVARVLAPPEGGRPSHEDLRELRVERAARALGHRRCGRFGVALMRVEPGLSRQRERDGADAEAGLERLAHREIGGERERRDDLGAGDAGRHRGELTPTGG